MYVAPPIDENSATTFFGSVLICYGDLVLYEPRLLEMYDAILPRIDAAVGGKPKGQR